MLCKFCQKEILQIALDKKACELCYRWIIEQIKNPESALVRAYFRNNTDLACISYIKKFIGYELELVFNYYKEKTFVMKYMLDNDDQIIKTTNFLSFNKMMPLTPEFLSSFNDKLRLWNVLS